MQEYGQLIITTGSLSGGGVAGGAAGSGLPGVTAGSAFGSGIFVENETAGTSYLTFAPPVGQTLTIADAIADQPGSTGTNDPYAQSVGVVVQGGGTVKLGASGNDYTGNTTITAGSTLEIGSGASVGSGTIAFASGSLDTLVIDGTAPTNTIVGFVAGDTIDLRGVTALNSFAVVTTTTEMFRRRPVSNQLTVATAEGPVTLQLTGESSRTPFLLTSDGNGGTLITLPSATATSFTVSNENDFSQVLSFIDSGGANSHTNTAYTINILATGGTLDLTTDLNAINLASGSSLHHQRQRGDDRRRLSGERRGIRLQRAVRAGRDRHRQQPDDRRQCGAWRSGW